MPIISKMNWQQMLQFMQDSYAQNVHGISYQTSYLGKISIPSDEFPFIDEHINEAREQLKDRLQIARNWREDPYGDGSDCGTANEASLVRLILSILLWGKVKGNTAPVPFWKTKFSRIHGLALMDKSGAYDDLSDVIFAALAITDIPRVYQAIN